MSSETSNDVLVSLKETPVILIISNSHNDSLMYDPFSFFSPHNFVVKYENNYVLSANEPPKYHQDSPCDLPSNVWLNCSPATVNPPRYTTNDQVNSSSDYFWLDHVTAPKENKGMNDSAKPPVYVNYCRSQNSLIDPSKPKSKPKPKPKPTGFEMTTVSTIDHNIPMPEFSLIPWNVTDNTNGKQELQITSPMEKKQSSTRRRKQENESPSRYCCWLCPKHYADKKSLSRHVRTHSPEYTGCPHCGKKFPRKTYLDDHIRTHTGERPFGCSLCQKFFRCKRNLKQHLKTHSKERPYKCEKCSKEFKGFQTLKKHVNDKHP